MSLDPETVREEMVRRQIRDRGVRDPAVLAALRRIPRHLFVPPALRDLAYEDRPLPVGHGQTISQPYMVGVMSELLEVFPGAKVLEVGTGSGYQAAILAELGARVWSLEVVPELASLARRTLEAAGIAGVTVLDADGWAGLPQEAPFDRIVVTAAPWEIPPALVDQLGPGGRMVVPVGEEDQELVLLERTPEGIRRTRQFQVRFVPMIQGRGSGSRGPGD